MRNKDDPVAFAQPKLNASSPSIELFASVLYRSNQSLLRSAGLVQSASETNCYYYKYIRAEGTDVFSWLRLGVSLRQRR